MPILDDDDDLEIPGFLRAEQRVSAAIEAADAADDDDFGDILDGAVDDGPEEEEAPKPKAAKKPKKAPAKKSKPEPDELDMSPNVDRAENPRAVAGSNSGIASDQLRSFVERIERLEEEQQALAEDKKEVYAEAKGNGFDTKTIRTVIRLRKQDANERAEQEALLDLYMHALGMATPV